MFPRPLLSFGVDGVDTSTVLLDGAACYVDIDVVDISNWTDPLRLACAGI